MWSTVFFLLKGLYHRQYTTVTFAFLVSGIGAVMSAMMPYYTSNVLTLLTDTSTDDSLGALRSTLVTYFGLSCILSLTTAARARAFTVIGERALLRYSEDVYYRILHQPLWYYQREGSTKLTKILTQDARQVSEQLSLNLNVLFRSFIQFTVIIWTITRRSYLLAYILLVTFPLSWFIHKTIHKNLYTLADKHKALKDQANALAVQVIQHPFAVKSYNCQTVFYQKYCSILQTYRGGIDTYANTHFQATFIASILPLLTTAIVLVSCGYIVSLHDVRKDLIMVYMYLPSLQEIFQHCLDTLLSFGETFQRVRDIHTLYLASEQHKYSQRYGIYSPSSWKGGRIELKELTFCYPSSSYIMSPTIKDVTLSIEPGEKVGVVGKNGSGKSTLIKLLTGMYIPTSGKVLLDDRPLQSYNPEWLYSNMVVVPQEPSILTGSVREALCFGKEYDDDALWAALNKVSAFEFVRSLPDGLETVLTERGGNLSGGQRQKLLIARALLRQPRILLLDEATCAVDISSKNDIQATLSALSLDKNLTIITVAHDTETLKGCDRVIHIDNGRIVTNVS
jgi:ABC-type multidrug transport system fused ATPase/permease subunit